MQSLLDQIMRFSDNPLLLFAIIFLLAVVNLFFPPIPLESITLLAGYLSGAGRASLTAVISATTLGMFTGSMLLYYLSRHYQTAVITATPLRKIISRNAYQRAVAWFKKYGLWAIFGGKLVPGMSLYTTICCGILNLNPVKAAAAFFGSNLIFFTILALLGRTFGRHWSRIVPILHRWNRTILIIIGLALAVCIGYYFLQRDKKPLSK